LKRNNECLIETSAETINSQFILERLEELSTKLRKLTVVVLVNSEYITYLEGFAAVNDPDKRREERNRKILLSPM